VSASRRPSFTIGDGSNTLTLESGSSRDGESYLRATLLTPNLWARADLHEGPGSAHFSTICELFESFVTDWRGWDGERSYYAIDAGLALHATHDHVANVIIRVVLRNLRDD